MVPNKPKPTSTTRSEVDDVEVGNVPFLVGFPKYEIPDPGGIKTPKTWQCFISN
jgi:hypothetical protein